MFQDFLSRLGMKKTNSLKMQMLRKKIPLSLKAQKFPLKKKKAVQANQRTSDNGGEKLKRCDCTRTRRMGKGTTAYRKPQGHFLKGGRKVSK